jgi:hypothetical protein
VTAVWSRRAHSYLVDRRASIARDNPATALEIRHRQPRREIPIPE